MTRTKDELIEAMTDISYELSMAAATAERLAVMQGILQVEGVGIVREDEVAALGIDRVVFPLDRVLANALFESMLLHTRNLFEFLVRSGSRPDDMRISDFSEETWLPGPAAEVDWLNQMWDLFNKHLAHLTWARVHGPLSWDATLVVSSIVQIAQSWHDHLRDHARHAELHEALSSSVADAVRIVTQSLPRFVYGS